MKQLQPDLFIPDDFVADHSYYADEKGEKEYTGITTILRVMAKPALIPWAVKLCADYVDGFIREAAEHADWSEMFESGKWEELLAEAKRQHTKVKEAAGTHGTDTHALVEEYINLCIKEHAGCAGLLIDEKFRDVGKFIQWSVDNVERFLYSERPVHSKELWLAGTIDFGAVMKDGTRRVGDLKTSSGIYYEAILQTEFYQMLAEEEGDEKYDGSVIVNLKKDGTLQTQVRARNELDKQAALGLLAAYRGNASFVKPK